MSSCEKESCELMWCSNCYGKRTVLEAISECVHGAVLRNNIIINLFHIYFNIMVQHINPTDSWGWFHLQSYLHTKNILFVKCKVQSENDCTVHKVICRCA